MKYLTARHNPTAFEPSKKARSPSGRSAATRLYYTTQIKQTMLCKPPGGSMPRRAVFAVSRRLLPSLKKFLQIGPFTAQIGPITSLC